MDDQKRKDIDVSEYRVMANRAPISVTMDHILDMMYSSFAFQVVQRYVLPLARISLYKKYEKKKVKLGLQKHAFLTFDESINEAFLHNEFASWVLLQNKVRTNKNPFLPTKIVDEIFLQEPLKFYFQHRSDVIQKQIPETEAVAMAKKVIAQLSLKKLFPALNKHHTPPLMRKEAPKEFKAHVKESAEVLNVETLDGKTKEEKATLVKIGQKVHSLDDFSIDELTVGYRLEDTDDLVFLRLQYPLLDEEYKRLKDRFIPKGRLSIEEASFLLLTLYSGFNLLYKTPFARGVLDIKDPKLKRLHETATSLLGTPFTVPSGKTYFSLFPEVEKHFGSIGSFFEAQPITGVYSLIPVPSFAFMSYSLDRVEAWLNDAKKNGHDLTIMFWYPRLHPTLYVDVELEFNKNSNREQDMIYDLVNKDLLPRLEAVKHKKEVINYAHGKRLDSNAKNYVFKVFVFST